MAGDETKETKKKGDELVRVLMTTSMGDIVIDLNRTKAPISVDNFLQYVDEGYYDGTIFHRIIATFMIQGGGFTAEMKKKDTHEPIQNEWENGLKNKRGSIAMARTNAPHSATSQFFINVVDNDMLDQPRGGAAYAVFGEVVEGMDVVDKIKAVKTGPHPSGMRDVPAEPVVIKKVTRVEAKDKKAESEKAKPAEGE
jgi:cyclophilin family peptidyl-prolyl cis-trans isomerase